MLAYFINMHLSLEPLVQTCDRISTFEVMVWCLIWPSLSFSLILPMTLMLVFLPCWSTWHIYPLILVCSMMYCPPWSHHDTSLRPLSLPDASTLVCRHYTICTSRVTIYYLQVWLWHWHLETSRTKNVLDTIAITHKRRHVLEDCLINSLIQPCQRGE